MKSASLPWKILIMVNKICEHYEISNSEIELACVGLSALDKVFSYVSILCINDSNYDLLGAIQHKWKYSPIHWKFCHVAGLQDDHALFESLDHWGKLNLEMD